MDFTELRRSIPATKTITYLNTGWAGPAPTAVLERMREAGEKEALLGPASPAGLDHARQIRADAAGLVGRVLHVSPEDLLLTHGTTEGVNIVLHGLDWQPGDELVTCDLEHPALSAPTTLLQHRRGVLVRRVSLHPKATSDEVLEVLRQALTPRTRVVALSHIMFTSGLRIPAKEVVETARENGSLVLLDGAQTAGHIAIDLGEVQPDFYTVSGQKWLMGPTGVGALYARPEVRPLLTPLFTGPGLDSREGIRMLGLTSDSTVLTAGFAEALELHLTLGPAAVEARIMSLAGRLRMALTAIDGVTITGPVDSPAACGLTAISVRGWEPEALAAALWELHRIAARTVRHPAGVRLSTAVFNNEADVDRAVDALDRLAQSTA